RENAGLLTRQALGRKRRVGGCRRRVRHTVEQPLQAYAARVAPRASRQVLLLGGHRRVEHAQLDETIVGEMSRHHQWRSRSRRSLRTARNKCTRTVASLTPSAWLTSAVVCSARWHIVNTVRWRSGSDSTAAVISFARSLDTSRCSGVGSGV